MAVYAVGDIQGCYDELCRLLETLRFDPEADHLWFVGDLVNRGPQSLATLRFVRSLGNAAVTVLGNHDLHLVALALAPGGREPEAELRQVLEAPDAHELVEWLRSRPLLHYEPERNTCLVHAGVYPWWNMTVARRLATEAEAALSGASPQAFLANMYGSQPDRWDESLSGHERLRFIVNSFTRMRYCRSDGSLDFAAKLAPDAYDDELRPWFRVPGRLTADTRIVFGHWSTLGYVADANTIGLDTGCVWGGSLTAVCLDSPGSPVSVDSLQPRRF